jgi:hypothetical protein
MWVNMLLRPIWFLVIPMACTVACTAASEEKTASDDGANMELI